MYERIDWSNRGLGEHLGAYLGEVGFVGDEGLGLCCDSCASGRPCDSHGLAGLGLSLDTVDEPIDFIDPDSGDTGGIGNALLNAGFGQVQADPVSNAFTLATTAVSFVPGVGPIASGALQIAGTMGKNFAQWFHLGAGRREADLITGPPDYIQNKVFQRIVDISNQGLNSSNVQTLQNLAIELQQLRSLWLTFLSNTSQFHDGRASEQAADTIMPYLDGTCGYHWPPPLRPDWIADCGTVHQTPTGNAWPGTWGDNGAGLLGAIRQRIMDYGGQVPAFNLTQGVGVPSLSLAIPGLAQLPQAGFLPPVSPLSPIHAGFVPDLSGGQSSLLPVLAAAGLLLMR